MPKTSTGPKTVPPDPKLKPLSSGKDAVANVGGNANIKSKGK